MKITSKALAWACVTLVVLYPASALLVWYVAFDNHYGIMAALFATNAGTAFLIHLVFGQPEFSDHTPKALKLSVLFVAAASGLGSAVFWLAGEVDSAWLLAGFVSPAVFTLLMLAWFGDKVNEEVREHEGE